MPKLEVVFRPAQIPMHGTHNKRAFDATGRREVRIGSGLEHTLDMIHVLHYDLEEFIHAYKLTPLEGRKVFLDQGPRRDDLDDYMRRSPRS
jgi:hypothetical protein